MEAKLSLWKYNLKSLLIAKNGLKLNAQNYEKIAKEMDSIIHCTKVLLMQSKLLMAQI